MKGVISKSGVLVLLVMLSACSSLTTEPPPLPPDMNQTLKGKPMPRWEGMSDTEIAKEVSRLFPGSVPDREDWAQDLVTAYTHLELSHAPSTYCASIAVVQQESSFQADPAVPNLGGLVMRELKERAERFFIPDALLEGALEKNSPDGKTWKKRIQSLRTERELNLLFEDMLSYLPFGKTWLEDFIPVRTAGPMQVSVAYAKQKADESGYPHSYSGSLRSEVFTRRGGLYFGAAILMDYPVQYTDPLHRFADFNAGRYASRNAAFQNALNSLTGAKLALDGDLLKYVGGVPSLFASQVEKTLQSHSSGLQLTKAELREDLLLEKQPDFSDTRTYNRVFQQAEQKAGKLLPRALVPRIELNSPKITSRLTTSWFASKVKRRFNDCLNRY